MDEYPVWLVFIGIGIALVVGFSVLRIALIALDRSYAALERVCEAMFHGGVRGVQYSMRTAGHGLHAAIMTLVGLALFPFIFIWKLISELMSKAFSPILDRMDEERELKGVWQREFRDQYKTFREFKEAINNPYSQHSRDDAEEPSFGPSHDDGGNIFLEACQLLELPESGEFTFDEFERRFRKMRSISHPDKGGSNYLYVKIEQASVEIRREKGWT